MLVLKNWVLRFQSAVDGMPPERVALLIAVGLVLGTFPIVGVPTLLCLAAGAALRLNMPALQLLNSLSSPLQLALLVPLERAGARLCGAAIFPGGRAGAAAIHTVTGWACICIPLGMLLYVTTIALLRKGRTVCFNNLKSPA